MKKLKSILFVLTFILGVISCKHKQQKNNKLIIATAANMQFATKEIAAQFSKHTGIDCEIIVGSSGKLTSQIKNGAPYDIFLSANLKYPNELFRLGIATKKPRVYALGRLVLWTADKKITPSVFLLKSENIKHVAIANPKIAPYGIAAKQVLKHYGIYRSIKPKLVYGENIMQTNQFIKSKAADIGFTSKSIVLHSKTNDIGNFIEIDTTAYTPISQGIVILKTQNHKYIKAQEFYNFIFSTQSKNILNKFGYSTLN